MSEVQERQTPATDLMAGANIQCPFPAYEKLRQDTPIYFYEKGHCFVVSRMADIEKIIDQPLLFSSDLHNFLGVGPELAKHYSPEPAMFMADPPNHTRTRATVDRAFTMPQVEAMMPEIRRLVNEAFDGFIGRGEVEAFTELALPVPMKVIAGQLGIPFEDISLFKRWSDAVTNAYNTTKTSDEREALAPDLQEFNAYMLAKRAEKAANPTNDIISVLAQALAGEDGGLLSDGEFFTIMQQLLTAGNETTATTIMSSLYRLAKDPALFAQLKANRGQIRAFVEEVLRLDSPVLGMMRHVTGDAEVAGTKIPKGSLVMLLYGSANHDETVFDRPDELDITRKNLSRHLSFGWGIHRCIGQMLGRKEIACVLEVLCDRVKTLSLAPGYEPNYTPSTITRALDSLQLTFVAEG